MNFKNTQPASGQKRMPPKIIEQFVWSSWEVAQLKLDFQLKHSKNESVYIHIKIFRTTQRCKWNKSVYCFNLKRIDYIASEIRPWLMITKLKQSDVFLFFFFRSVCKSKIFIIELIFNEYNLEKKKIIINLGNARLDLISPFHSWASMVASQKPREPSWNETISRLLNTVLKVDKYIISNADHWYSVMKMRYWSNIEPHFFFLVLVSFVAFCF